MKKYLFVDFDGVLNTNRHRYHLIQEGKNTKDRFGPIFDPNAVENLRNIILHTGAEIIISSSWKEFGTDFLYEMREIRQLPEFHSITPSLVITNYLDNNTGKSFSIPEQYSKGLEINAWLNIYATHDSRYCIIDDEIFFLPHQLAHLVQVNEDTGLTEEAASIIIEKLLK